MSFTKADLKTGMHVQNRAGDVYVVINNTIQNLSSNDSWNHLDSFNDYFKNMAGFEELDIVKVWDVPPDWALMCNYVHGELLFSI